jgi:hypothetical protein
MSDRKRAHSETETGHEVERQVRARCDQNPSLRKSLSLSTSILCKLPSELVNVILEDLSRSDLLNLSLVDRRHRGVIFPMLFKSVFLKWMEIESFVENFKSLDIVEKVSIRSDLNNVGETNKGEWNASFKKMFERCTALWEMDIDLLTSGRCLKYKDDFDTDLSDKIEKMTLRSHSQGERGSVDDKAMFELTQLQRFHRVKSLRLIGFSICKDIYFYPKVKEDMSDYMKRRLDGKLIDLKELTLVNCAWEYPITLKEVFAPEYPIPGIAHNGVGVGGVENCRLEKLSVIYTDEYIRFTACERFKSFVDTEHNDKFLFEIDFYKDLKELEMSCFISKDRYDIALPWIGLINLGREFCVESEETPGLFIKTSLLRRLEKLTLQGWRYSSVQDVERVFAGVSGGSVLRHVRVSVAQQSLQKSVLTAQLTQLTQLTQRLRSVLHHAVQVQLEVQNSNSNS